MVATAESCTGGLIAGALTEVPGSSDVVDRGFVTYSNEAKTEMLGVPAAMIAAHGAVSEEVARAMAEGALARSRAQVAVSVTGIAGPGGGSVDKPVGLVWFGCASANGHTKTVSRNLAGDRTAIRTETVIRSLRLLLETANAASPFDIPCRRITSLTDQQAYAAMFYYFEHYWTTTQIDELAAMLGSMSLLPSGAPVDAGVTANWNRAVQFALTGGEAGKLEIKRE